ncbi:DNA cytosine methyltransferase [Antrihabitans cavernicola]|uniref:DNA cytosine methyltransferase n=1 Tax=Antrihabitans cavernicola TaxID=2495913 RepID=A0A5A7S6P3_9NOCA|nr:DNA cytosine methyltransferase [Spelaeibacter cavernicola]KAA0021818.1 DNA cytosine methyltransferase [Spelaeibacter cavernicola]
MTQTSTHYLSKGKLLKPKLLDLFCCAGGAAEGYDRAGFEVIGVDIIPQPNSPFEFHQADALDFLRWNWTRFDAVHASPPCQAYSAMKHMPDAKAHPELIEPTRELLTKLGLPWVIENVVGAPMAGSIVLCGSMFALNAQGFGLRRHRQFESSLPITAPRLCEHSLPTIGVYGGHVRCRSSKFWRETGADFPGYDKKSLAYEAMGIGHKMTMNELSEAIPPAYTEHIGRQLLSGMAPASSLFALAR